MQKNRVFSYSSKLFIVFFLVLLIAVVLVKLLGFGIASDVIKEDALLQSSMMTKQLSDRLDNLFSEIDRLSQSILADERVIRVLEKSYDEGSISFMEADSVVMEAIDKMLLFRSDIMRVMITNGFNSYAGGPFNYRSNPAQMYESSEVYDFLDSENLYLIIPPHLSEYNQNVFSFIRKIRRYNNPEILGLITIDVRITTLDSIFAASGLDSSSVVIFDDGCNPVYSSGNKLSYELFPLIGENLEQQDVQFSLSWGEDRMIVTVVYSPYTNMYICRILYESQLFQKLSYSNRIFTLVAIAVMIVSTMLLLMSSRLMTRSIREMTRQIKDIEESKRESLDIRRNDEIGMIAGDVNHMVNRIIELINHNTAITIRNREAELKILQGELDPHFLFNTLECIRMKAFVTGDNEVAAMLEKLGLLYRAVLDSSAAVTLAEDIGYVENYIELQNLRFRERTVFTDAVPNIFRTICVPRLMLLTLAENTIRHGFQSKKGKRFISLECVLSDGDCLMIFSDNGDGIKAEKLKNLIESINAPLDLNGSHERHIGLKNLNSRIKLYFGNEYGLSIHSKEGKGTTITIRLPYEGKGGDCV